MKPATNPFDLKRCSRCKLFKPRTTENFCPRNYGARDGFNSQCRACTTQYQRATWDRRRDKARERKGQTARNPVSDKWTKSKWVKAPISKERLSRIKASAERAAKRYGHEWLTDDLVQCALIEAHQGHEKLNMKFLFWNLYEKEFGRIGTPRNGFETATRCDAVEIGELEI